MDASEVVLEAPEDRAIRADRGNPEEVADAAET
jgi:hypothetical protein